MGDFILGETVSEEPENATTFGDEAFVSEHVAHIKQKLLHNLCKLEHLPHKLSKGEAGLQIAWAASEKSSPAASSTFYEDVTAEFCDDVQGAIRSLHAGAMDGPGTVAAREARAVHTADTRISELNGTAFGWTP